MQRLARAAHPPCASLALGLLLVFALALPAVAEANSPPAASPDRMFFGGPTNVLANDSDPDLDQLTLISYTQPETSTVTCSADGTCSSNVMGLDWCSSNPPTGSFAFTYTVSDGNGGTAVGTVNQIFVIACLPPQCSDTNDNDGDGNTDYPNDPDCASVADNSESPDPPPPPQCSDAADNDGDTKVDYPADPGCSSATDDSESPDPPPPPQCSDAADNDGDTKVDYPADPGCSSATDDSESPDPLTSKDQCMNGGWRAYGFKNQGDCVSSVTSKGKGK